MQIIRVLKRIYFELSKIVIPRKTKIIKRVSLPDFDIYVFANEDVGRKIFLFKEFEKSESDYFKKNILPEDICVDVGGNIGYFSLLFAKLAFSGKTYAFEPIAENGQMIKLSADINQITNIIVNENAVGNKNEPVSFSVSEDSAFSSMNSTDRVAEEQNIVVQMIRIDDFVRSSLIARIDILKIDVEGAEELVLKGAFNVLSDPEIRPRIILVELYDKNLSVYKTSKLSILEMMKSIKYMPYVIDVNQGCIPYIPEKHAGYYNFIFKNDDGVINDC
jgi:FkbM family methyltransferase